MAAAWRRPWQARWESVVLTHPQVMKYANMYRRLLSNRRSAVCERSTDRDLMPLPGVPLIWIGTRSAIHTFL